MSTINYAELSSRIKKIRSDADLNKNKFAKSLKISPTFIGDIESGKNKKISPSLARLISIQYGFSEKWILSGEGVMKLQAPIPPASEAAQKVSSAITMALRVLSSDTSYADALYLNIVHFDRAIQAEKQQTIDATRLSTLENQVAELAQQVKAYQEENRYLKQLRSSEEESALIDASSGLDQTSSPKTK